MSRAATFVWALCTLGISSASGQAPVPPADSTLAAITARGRALLRYDIAAWHAGDAVMALKPLPGEINASFARLTPSGRWEVVFGRLTASKDTFYVTYRATQTDADSQFTAAKLETPVADVGLLREMALAFQTAQQDFGRITRPYNSYVIPSPRGGYWVYLLPAQTDPRTFPLGGDMRYRITAGSTVAEKVRFHNAVLDRPMPTAPSVAGQTLVAMVHSSFDSLPSETDVFVVLRRVPRIPEVVVTHNFIYQIAIDGTITWTRAKPPASPSDASAPAAPAAAQPPVTAGGSNRPVFWDPAKVRVAGLAIFDKIGAEIGRAAREAGGQPWLIQFPNAGAAESWDSLRRQLVTALHAREPAPADSLVHTLLVQHERYGGDTLIVQFVVGEHRQCRSTMPDPEIGTTYEARSVATGPGRWGDPQTDWVERATGGVGPCGVAPTMRVEVRSPAFTPSAMNVASFHPSVPADTTAGECMRLSAAPGLPANGVVIGMRFGKPRPDRTVVLRFDSTGKLLSYAESRGDVTAPPYGADAINAAPRTMISIDLARQSVMMRNEGGGKPAEAAMAFGPDVLTAPSLGVPQPIIDRIVRECRPR